MIGSLVRDCGRPRRSCQDKLQRRSRTLEKMSVEHLDLKEKKIREAYGPAQALISRRYVPFLLAPLENRGTVAIEAKNTCPMSFRYFMRRRSTPG